MNKDKIADYLFGAWVLACCVGAAAAIANCIGRTSTPGSAPATPVECFDKHYEDCMKRVSGWASERSQCTGAAREHCLLRQEFILAPSESAATGIP